MRKKYLKILLSVAGGLLLLLVGVALYAYSTYRSLIPFQSQVEGRAGELKEAVKEQDLVKVKTALGELDQELGDLRVKIDSYRWLAKLPWVKSYYQDLNHGLSAASAGVTAVNLVVETIAPYADILGLKGAGGATESAKTTLDRVTFLVTTLDKIRPKLDDIGQELTTAREAIDQIDPRRYPGEFRGMKVRENLSLAISTVDQAASLVNDAKPLIEELPDLLGVSGPKYYFVLFQNDAELRPTGGFMTAYGILKVDNGKITPVLSEDIYSLDAVFGKRLPPPEPIKKYHKNVNQFFLRDMNLSPDFKESMELFMGYYQRLSVARKVDGVVAVDTKLLASLLAVLGTVGVPEWGNFSAEIDKRCDCPSVVYRLEEIADRPISGLNASRKAVIGPLMHSILANAFNSPKEKMAPLFNVGITAVNEKHLLLYLFAEKAQEAVEKFNLAGRVREYAGDYQLLVDTNFAGAKSNLFISQKIEEKIEIDQGGQVTKTVVISYDNPFPPSNCNLEAGGLCLNGLYRNWFRLYVPEGSQLLEMTGSEVQPEVYEELGKTVFAGFYGDKFPLSPQSRTKVTIKYRLPFKVEKGQEYRLLIQKQPGVEKYAFELDFAGQKQEFDLRADKELKWLR